MLRDLFLILKGGAGSGNYGHEGVSGKRGGSAPRGGGTGKYKPFSKLSFPKTPTIEFLNTKTPFRVKVGWSSGDKITSENIKPGSMKELHVKPTGSVEKSGTKLKFEGLVMSGDSRGLLGTFLLSQYAPIRPE